LNRAGAEGKASSTVEEMNTESVKCDPTIFCSSFKRRRFYCFSSREPDESTQSRDILNEKPTEEERLAEPEGSGRGLPTEVIMRTTMGDIHIKLFANECPKTIENFATHAKNGYYNGVIFHRVIKGFMIQTGDPLGNGTGGESIWGGEFKDEFHRTLRHDRPFTVSMANAGPNTNGSQFFITTVPTLWLDNKHTVFGRVVDGYEVCKSIENLKVNKHDKPVETEVKIISIDVA
jgi:peptidylprolyl isomerase domain and WD repeat-containing protein 1